jgi:hypothetical protein
MHDHLFEHQGALEPHNCSPTRLCSNPRAMSADVEGWNGERYGCYLTIESWSDVIAGAGFVLESQYLRPSGKLPSKQPWLAMVWRKPRS